MTYEAIGWIGLIHTARILARVALPTKLEIFTQNRAG